MRLFVGIVYLVGLVTLCAGQPRNKINIQPTCDVKQVLYGMKFPIPFCRACEEQTCFMTKLTADAERQVKDVFTGFFFTSEHIAQVEEGGVDIGNPARRKRGSEDHDGDIHCPTKLTCQNFTRLTNSYGIERELVHLPVIGEFQWVLEGKCANVESDCRGGCVEQTTTQFLLVWNLDHPSCPMSFEPFDIKAYCSCKNVDLG